MSYFTRSQSGESSSWHNPLGLKRSSLHNLVLLRVSMARKGCRSSEPLAAIRRHRIRLVTVGSSSSHFTKPCGKQHGQFHAPNRCARRRPEHTQGEDVHSDGGEVVSECRVDVPCSLVQWAWRGEPLTTPQHTTVSTTPSHCGISQPNLRITSSLRSGRVSTLWRRAGACPQWWGERCVGAA